METTSFSDVYEYFYSMVTDDDFLEITEAETEAKLQEFLMHAIHWFEMPRVNLNDLDLDLEMFNVKLSREEMNILATYMVAEWYGQQISNVDNTRQLYTGSEFKMTSQGNHIQKLSTERDKYRKDAFHLQRLYKRRTVDQDGKVVPTMGLLMTPRDQKYRGNDS